MHDTNLDYSLASELLSQIQADPMGAWYNLPETAVSSLETINAIASEVQNNADYLVCVGIGGSYLGARAVYEALTPFESHPKAPHANSVANSQKPVKLLFAGNSLSSFELKRVLNALEGHDFYLNIISKSGTTLEPTLAFRVLKKLLESRYGKVEARKRIIATTDPTSGLLRVEAEKYSYRTLEIPAGAGGRYSVLSPVGLFPLACAGIDVSALLAGARECKENQLSEAKLKSSMLLPYAFSRFYLYDELNCDTEVLASFEPRLLYFNEWWKQLFGESEGKGGQGIFPASVIYSTDLHSLGQYLQDGRRNIFETFLKFSPDVTSLTVPSFPEDLDGLEYLAGRTFSDISDQALAATLKAHNAGGISTFEIEVFDPDSATGLSEKVLGFLIFFFEVACALSALLHGVDPFDQPGVEKYKKEMQKLLHK